MLTDYEEIYLPVTQLSSIRTLLAFAAEKKLQVHQMYIVSAFLNGDLTVYNLTKNCLDRVTEWPIKMKFGWPLPKLIGHYKFECLVV